MTRPAPRARLIAVAAIVAAATVGVTSQAGNVPAGAAERDAVVVDDDVAPTNPLDPALLPAGLAAGPDRLVGAKGVESLQPDGSSGFLPFQRRAYAYGAYRFELVASGSDGDIELLRPLITEVAAELTEVTRLTFSVAPGQVARPVGVTRFPPGWCAAGAAHQCTFFADGDPSVGVIRIGFSSASPCRTLAPRGTRAGAVGCAGPESARDGAGNLVHARGNVWLSPSLNDVNLGIAGDVIAHETGHVLGLDHYDRLFTAVPGRSPVRQLMYPSVHEESSDTGLRYRSGDANGLRWMQQPKAWYIAATYRDFLGRMPDTAGYAFWIGSDATPSAYVESLATSDEWIGRILTGFYRDVFGRTPDPAGFAYWSSVVRAQGVPAVAAQLYGSAEYVRSQGGSLAGMVAGLYRQLLGRDAGADPQGHAFWVAEAARRGTVAVALDFFQSLEKRRDRVHDLYCTLLERPPDPGGQAFWADVVLVEGDLALARNLATSAEYVSSADEYALLPVDAPPAC